jgi:hypothetical protein
MSMQWLLANAPGFNDLTHEERNAIVDFSLLWSLFEARILNNHGSAKAIRDTVHRWHETGTLEASAYDKQLAYFRQRYFEGSFTYHFEHLHLRSGDQKALVQSVIDGSNNDAVAVAATVLIIVFRYRNNLFHGIKWSYELAGQLDNFTHANNALMTALDHHGQLNG